MLHVRDDGYSGSVGKIPSKSHPLPPAGTSARKAYEKTVKQGTSVSSTPLERLTGTYNYPGKAIVDSVIDGDTKPKSPRRRRYISSGGSGRRTFEYYEAPLSEKYGFGKSTAYQEALANTAYRREMDDMRKAGLNPSVIYGNHNSNGADSNIYPREGSSGGSGYRRRSGGKKSGNYLFSGGAYYGLMFAAGAIAAAATGNFGAGMATAGLAGTAMKALNGFSKK